MVLASRPLFAYVILPAWPGPLSLLSRGGGIQVHPTRFALGLYSPKKRVAIEKQAHTIHGQDKGPIYIQPIVLQEGVHTNWQFT